MSNSNNKKRSFGDLEAEDDVEHFTMKKRKHEFSERTWWMVDLDCATESNQGATALVKRCMRNYGWNLDKTKGILKAYRQFLTLKKEQEDWDATILSPSHLVDQMWHQHILDIGNYYHDMMMLCGGQIVLHNPDGALDREAKKSRDERTRAELIKKFGSENVDREVWGFPTQPATKTNRPNNKIKIPTKIITIAITSEDGEATFFKMKTKTKMGNVFATWARRRFGRSASDFRFFFDGDVVKDDATPAILEMEDGDRIEAFIDLCGC